MATAAVVGEGLKERSVKQASVRGQLWLRKVYFIQRNILAP